MAGQFGAELSPLIGVEIAVAAYPGPAPLNVSGPATSAHLREVLSHREPAKSRSGTAPLDLFGNPKLHWGVTT